MIILGVGLHELPLRLGLLALRLIERRLERPRINLKQHLPLLDKGPFCIALLEQVARHLRLDHRIDMPSRVPIHSLEGGVSDLLIAYQTDTPNSYRLINSPITKSCMRSVLETQIVRRTNRLIRVRMLMCLLSIFWVFAFPTVCCSASRYRS